MPGVVLLLIMLALVCLAFRVNRDPLSPAKFYLTVLFVFFADVYISPYPPTIYVTYLGLQSLGFLAICLEHAVRKTTTQRPPSFGRFITSRVYFRAVVLVWILSLIPIAAQLYFFYLAGGLEQYVNSIGLRVVQWRGMGPLRVLVSLMPLLNVLYFAATILNRERLYLAWLLYLSHLCIMVAFGLLSGSRTSLLYVFVLLALVYHYLRRRLSARFVASFAAALLAIALVMGVARTGHQWTGEGLRTGYDHITDQFAKSYGNFRYGLISLELVYERGPDELQYGLTYATVITNFIPRAWWPGKPDTGGVVLTKDYTGDRWQGASNLAPGALAEGILNFGGLGVLVGFGVLTAAVWLNFALYRKVIIARSRSEARAVWLTITYGLVVIATTNLLWGEFTSLTIGLITKVIPVMGIYLLALHGRIKETLPGIDGTAHGGVLSASAPLSRGRFGPGAAF